MVGPVRAGGRIVRKTYANVQVSRIGVTVDINDAKFLRVGSAAARQEILAISWIIPNLVRAILALDGLDDVAVAVVDNDREGHRLIRVIATQQIGRAHV